MENNYNARIEKAIQGFKEENEKNALYVAVAEDLLQETNEDLNAHIKDIIEYGCVSGIVNSQIYYSDTKKFFQKYCDEIFEALAEDSFICDTENLNSNDLSWYGYEHAVRKIYEYINDYADI